jgi:hypothetical protein
MFVSPTSLLLRYVIIECIRALKDCVKLERSEVMVISGAYQGSRRLDSPGRSEPELPLKACFSLFHTLHNDQ